MIIIDTSIWIPALRNRTSPEKAEVQRLILEDAAAAVGIVLVEVLRGARDRSHFDELYDQMRGALLIEDDEGSWLRAAELLLDLKLRGEVIPLPDAMIAAQALLGGHAVYTADPHFARIAGLRLHVAGQQA